MSKNTSITIGSHFEQFINEQIESGRFNSASEIVRAGLRLLEDQEHKLSALRAALIAGENSGFSNDSSLNSIMKKLGRE